MTIEDAPVPQAEPEITEDKAPELVDIGEPEVPLAEPVYWALLNLLMMIASALISIFLLALYFFGKKRESGEDEETEESRLIQQTGDEEDEEESEEELKRKGLFRMLSLVPAAASVITFLLTEDMRNPWRWTDKWTLLMAVYLLAGIVLLILSKKKRVEADDDEEASQPVQG